MAIAYKKSVSSGFDEAIKYFGGPKGLGDVLGISASQIHKIRIGQHKLMFQHACKIEEMTHGNIKAIDLNEN